MSPIPCAPSGSHELSTDELPVAFFDVDGTLVYRDPKTGPGSVPSERVCEAVRAFAARGGIPIIASGRAMPGLAQLFDLLPFRGCVSLDGAYVQLDGAVIADRCFDSDTLEKMVSEMLRCGMAAFFEGTDGCVELSPTGESLYEWGEVARDLDGMARANPSLRFGKVDFIDAAMPAYRKSGFLQDELGYYDVGDGCHELVMPGVDKGSGLRLLADEVARRLSDGKLEVRTYAFGDSENDVAMFKTADVSVAMGQAARHVRQAADYVTDVCAKDGVATALEHLGLI